MQITPEQFETIETELADAMALADATRALQSLVTQLRDKCDQTDTLNADVDWVKIRARYQPRYAAAKAAVQAAYGALTR